MELCIEIKVLLRLDFLRWISTAKLKDVNLKTMLLLFSVELRVHGPV